MSRRIRTVQQTLRRIPMTVVAVLFGLVVGGIVWETLDNLQQDTLSEIFEQAIAESLDQRARATLVRFDNEVTSFSSLVRLLANHRRLVSYAEIQGSWANPLEGVIEYRNEQPPWLPSLERWLPLSPPSHVLLIDRDAQTREIYFHDELPVPSDLVGEVARLHTQGVQSPFLAVLDTRPYVLASDWIQDDAGNVLGAMMLVVPVDSWFLNAAYPAMEKGVLTGILDGDTGTVLASSDLEAMQVGAMISDFERAFATTYQSFSQYEGMNQNLQFATLVKRSYLREITRGVSRFARRQRATAAIVFVVVYSLLFMLVSQRLAKALKRLADLSERALGFTQSPSRTGNQLFVLEDWMRGYIRRVRDAREELKAKHETEIQASAALTEAIMEASLDSIITIDEKGHVIEFNSTAEKMFGYSRSMAVDQDLRSLVIGESDRDSFRELIASCHDDARDRIVDVRTELMAMREDGSEFPVEVAVKPIALQGRALFTVYMHDISERRRQEQEIRALAAFPSESPSPVMRVNFAGVIIYANDASEPLLKYWGCRRAQTLPLNWRQRIQSVLDKGTTSELEIHANGQSFSLLMAPIAELGYVNIYARDITDARVAEAQARQHQTELVHVCRLSTMGEMATGIAHELNQPLSAIVNYANGTRRRLERGQGSPEKLEEPLKQIASQAERAGEIIRRLRALVSQQPVQRAKVKVNDLVREVLSFVDYEIRRFDISMETELRAHLPFVYADLVQIEQVILNLVRNAIDAVRENDEGGRKVRISTSSSNDGTVSIRIDDWGPGLTSEVRKRLFEPFFSTKNTGMGMGLVISQTIAEDHGGKITADSLPNQGASFVLSLPGAESREATAIAS